MKKQIKYIKILLVVALIWTILIALPIVPHVIAATSLTDTNIGTKTSGDVVWSLNGTQASITVETEVTQGKCGTEYTTKSGTLTLTNTNYAEALLSFKCSKIGSGSFKIDGAEISEDSFSITLTQGKSITIVVTSADRQADTTEVILSDITLTPKTSITVTFQPVSGISYSVGDQEVTNEPVQITAETSNKHTITVNTASYYCVYLNWTDGTNSDVYVLDASNQIQPTQTCTITPVFIHSQDGIAPFKVGTASYWTWEAAFRAAGAGQVTLADSYDLPTDLTGNLLEADGKYITFDETTKEITYSMPEGATLLVPYSLGNTSIGSVTSTVKGKTNSTLAYANNTWVSGANEGTDAVQAALLLPNTNVTYTLTIFSGTTVNVPSGSKFVVGGTLAVGNPSTAGISCAPCGAHANVELKQGATLNISGIASVCGYILGNGQVNVSSGGKVYQPFTLMDFRNGPYVITAKEDSTFPFYRFTMQNIQSNIHMTYGATMMGYCALYTTQVAVFPEQINVTEVELISSAGLIRLTANATLSISYDASRYATEAPSKSHYLIGMYHRVGTTTLEFNGDVSMGVLTLSLSILDQPMSFSSSNDFFPIPYNYNIVFKAGTCTIPNKLKVMPGATVLVEEGAKLLVSSGGALAVMDALHDHVTLAANYNAAAESEFHYPSPEVLQAEPFNSNGAGNLILNGGTLEVASGASFGGLVQTTGKGSVIMKGSNSVTPHIGVVNTTTLRLTYAGFTIPYDIEAPMTGRTLHPLTAKVYGTDGKPITLSSGKTYTAVDNVKNTVASYSYNVYESNTSNTTIEKTQTLNADVIGSWVEGTALPDRDVEFSASNVRLGNNLDMMFAFPKFQPDADVLSNYYVQIVHTYANGRIDIKEIPFSQWRETTVNSTACYYVTYSGIGAKNMGDTIRAMVFYRTVDGDGKVTNVGVSKIWEDSIRAYSERMLTKYSSTDYSHLQTLLGDMLNYGAACQLRFHYNTKYLANADFGNTGTTTNPTIDENLKNTTVGNTYWIGSNVIADSNTSFVIGFTTKFEEGMYFTYTFTNHWKKPVEQRVYFNELTPVYGADGTTVEYYYHGLANLRIADVDSNITFEVFYADGTSTGVKWTDSVLGYVSRMNERADDVYMVLLKFANSAWKYLHEGKVVA